MRQVGVLLVLLGLCLPGLQAQGTRGTTALPQEKERIEQGSAVSAILRGLRPAQRLKGTTRCQTEEGSVAWIEWERVSYAEGYMLVRVKEIVGDGWWLRVNPTAGWTPDRFQLITDGAPKPVDMTAGGYAPIGVAEPGEYLIRHGKTPVRVETLRLPGGRAVIVVPGVEDADDPFAEPHTVPRKQEPEWVVISFGKDACDRLD